MNTIITKVRLSPIYERFGRFYIDIFHDVYESGRVVDSFKYANMPFSTRAQAEKFDWQHWLQDVTACVNNIYKPIKMAQQYANEHAKLDHESPNDFYLRLASVGDCRSIEP